MFGHQVTSEAFDYLNRYDQQISVLAEDRERIFMGWLGPGFSQFSTIRALRLNGPKKDWDMTTNTNGSHRAMVPIGMYELLMLLDVMPTFLLRVMLVDDMKMQRNLFRASRRGFRAALCEPGKEDYVLRFAGFSRILAGRVMKLIRSAGQAGTTIRKGSKLEKFIPFMRHYPSYTPGMVTKGTTHVREALDLKRMMIMVAVALMPCIGMAFYNTGYQVNLAIGNGAKP